MIPIEDFHEDIIGKAARGLGISKNELADEAGLTIERINALLNGEVDEEAIRALAPVLELDGEKLVVSANKAWRPKDHATEGLFQANTPYHDMLVNAFLLWDPISGKAAVFDTGTDCGPILEQINQRNLSVETVLITHTHGDHVADLDRLLSETGHPPVYANRLEPHPGAELIDAGWTLDLGSLSLRALLTSGHSVGGTSYLVNGLAQPVVVVGDALFAGSMGGGVTSFTDALRNNREKLMNLPDDTIVCPGHGPISTIAEEKKANPFFPEFKW
ncbi:MAG: MBL fold metallo-hydrolase [Opitutales bacterium]|nr:MBL fold metallo-hydrolase [Opitutales bacterium]